MSDFEIVSFIKSIEKETGVDIRMRTRKRNYVYSRVAFFNIIKKENPTMTLSKMGSFVGMDHSSVIHWLNSKANIEKYDDYAEIANAIKSIKIYKHTDSMIFCNQTTYPNGKK
jgi:chromosomal replication initiation ATPase DnaA